MSSTTMDLEKALANIPPRIDHSKMAKGSQEKKDAIRNNRRRGALLGAAKRNTPGLREAIIAKSREKVEERRLKAPENMQKVVDSAEKTVPRVYKRGGDKNPKTSDAEKLRIAKQADAIIPSTFKGAVDRSLYDQAFGYGNIKADSSGDDAFVQGLVSGCPRVEGADVLALTRMLLWKVLLGRLTAKTSESRYRTIVWAQADGKKPTKSHTEDPDKYSYGGARFLISSSRPAPAPVTPSETRLLPSGKRVYTRDGGKRWRYYAPGERENGKFVSSFDAKLIAGASRGGVDIYEVD